MKHLIYYMTIFTWITFGFGQNQNVNLIANVNDYPQTGYSDVWGYTAPNGDEYALLGVNNGVSVVNASDPNNIFEVEFIPFVNAPPFGWYDMKIYQNYMYVSSEGSTEILIVDLSGLPDSTSVIGTFSGLSSEPHNIFIDTEVGILYAVEDFHFNPVARIFSLADPENPAQISSIGPANNGTDSHDLFARDSLLYIAEGTSPSIGIFDVSDPANPLFLKRLNIPAAGYVHQVWVSEDNKYMVTTEETPEKTVKIWDIEDINSISLVGEYLGGSMLAHNAYFKGNFIYISHYESGLKVVDFSDPTRPFEAGFYDTFPQAESPNFNGAWGAYPFTQNGMIFVSDQKTGLYVLQFEQETGPQMVVMPAEIDFGNVHVNTTSNTLTVTIQNFGTADLTVTDITNPGAPFVLQNLPSLPVTLMPGESTGFNVVFSPTAVGVNNAVITLTSDDANEPTHDLPLSGQGFVLNPAEMGVCFATTGRQGDHPGSLITIDPATGAGTLVGSTGLGPVPGLAINATGEMYITTGFPQADLYRIDPVSGGVVFVGNTGQVAMEAIAFDGNGVLYGVGIKNGSDFPNSSLYTIETSTGIATSVGAAGVWLTGLAFDPTTGVLWASSGAGNFTPSDAIYTVDISTGTVTLVGKTGLGGSTTDIHFDQNGNLYGAKGGGQNPNNLISIDKDTGTGTVIGSIGFKAVAGMAARLDRTVVGIDDAGPGLPKEFSLRQSYPNPFNPSTTIEFTLPEAVEVTLTIYNGLGQEVATLVKGRLPAGLHSVIWQAKDLPSGVYFYRLNSGTFSQTRKMLLMK